MGRSRSRSDKSELKALLSWKKINTNNLKSVNQEPKAVCLEVWRYLAEELKTNRCFWMQTVISGRMDYGALLYSTENCVWLGHFVVQQKLKKHCKSTIFYFIYLFIFFLPWAAPVAYGGSQARGRIGAVAADLHQSHSNAGSELPLWPTVQLTATPDP